MTGLEIAGIVSIGVNLITSWIAKRHAKKSKLLPIVIRGVETAPDNSAVKRAIRNAATDAGVQTTLDNEVQRVVRGSTRPRGIDLTRGNRS